MLGETLIASIGLNITKFRAALNDAVKKGGEFRKKLAKELEPIGGGALLGKIGVAGLVMGLGSAVNRAQQLRDEADKIGTPISDSARAAAELGDNLDTAKGFMMDLASAAIGGFQRGVEAASIRLVAAFSDATVEGIKAQRAMERAEDERVRKQERDRREREREAERAAAEEARRLERLANLRKDLEGESVKAGQIGETPMEKMARVSKEYADAARRALDLEQGTEEQLVAQIAARRLGNELIQTQNDIAQQIVDSETDIADSNREWAEAQRDKIAALQKEADLVRQTMAEMERARNLPSLSEVASGERDIGPGARRMARELEKQRQREQRARDREQRAREREEREGSTGGKDSARRERDKAADEAAKARARQKEIEAALEGRVSGLGNETEIKQLNELVEIRSAVIQTAQALADVEASTKPTK